jgi:hypothetical protein
VTLARELAASLPDEPRWIDARAMLLSGHAEVLASTSDGFVVRVQHGALSAIAVAGRPPCGALRSAVSGTTELTPIVAQTIDAPHVAACLRGVEPAWTHESAIVHVQRHHPVDPPSPLAPLLVRFLEPSDRLDHLPPGLQHEMTHAREMTPVAAVIDGTAAVSFCYPVWVTETLWDVSVDTLEHCRGQGHAARAFRLMADFMRQRGREPVWGALASNAPSLRLAAKLGFRPVDRIEVFSRGGWVFMSRGFAG